MVPPPNYESSHPLHSFSHHFTTLAPRVDRSPYAFPLSLSPTSKGGVHCARRFSNSFPYPKDPSPLLHKNDRWFSLSGAGGWWGGTHGGDVPKF